uniref:Uncharacterized protein n=1 Tax=Strigamia maritima TaxID=126957 RepID=T1ITW2_STRMM
MNQSCTRLDGCRGRVAGVSDEPGSCRRRNVRSGPYTTTLIFGSFGFHHRASLTRGRTLNISICIDLSLFGIKQNLAIRYSVEILNNSEPDIRKQNIEIEISKYPNSEYFLSSAGLPDTESESGYPILDLKIELRVLSPACPENLELEDITSDYVQFCITFADFGRRLESKIFEGGGKTRECLPTGGLIVTDSDVEVITPGSRQFLDLNKNRRRKLLAA